MLENRLTSDGDARHSLRWSWLTAVGACALSAVARAFALPVSERYKNVGSINARADIVGAGLAWPTKNCAMPG